MADTVDVSQLLVAYGMLSPTVQVSQVVVEVAYKNTDVVVGSASTMDCAASAVDPTALFIMQVTPAEASCAAGAENPSILLVADVVLTWTDNSEHEDGFVLQHRLSGGAWSTVATPASNETSYTHEDQESGTHQYRIKATSSSLGDSEWSNIAEIVIP